MPIGERAHRRPAPPARGYTYLLLLFLVAAAGLAAAALGERRVTAAQREREAELLFRGAQIREALQRYHDQTPTGQPALPAALEDLLVDHRRTEPQQHLRRMYADPFTGQADWLLLRDEQGGIYGVRSRSTRPALRRLGVPRSGRPAGTSGTAEAVGTAPTPPTTEAPLVSDWLFAIQATRAAPRRSP